jgi:hypothetical protein
MKYEKTQKFNSVASPRVKFYKRATRASKILSCIVYTTVQFADKEHM